MELDFGRGNIGWNGEFGRKVGFRNVMDFVRSKEERSWEFDMFYFYRVLEVKVIVDRDSGGVDNLKRVG